MLNLKPKSLLNSQFNSLIKSPQKLTQAKYDCLPETTACTLKEFF